VLEIVDLTRERDERLVERMRARGEDVGDFGAVEASGAGGGVRVWGRRARGAKGVDVVVKDKLIIGVACVDPRRLPDALVCRVRFGEKK
jgi:hypothetical protein